MKLLIFIQHDMVHFCTEISIPDIVCNILDGKHPPFTDFRQAHVQFTSANKMA